ncbi:MAG: hypothetical protein IPO92_10025 [Saprospiraceae bacterium]|nr:hypothetical protein [Saprospiraceae bacterium]
MDWVKLELRNPSAPSTPTSFKASAFIKQNGDVVGLDGTSLPRVKNGFATSVIVLSHRNHLPIRTIDAGLDVVNPASQHNFSTATSQAFTSVVPVLPNANMKDLGGGVFGLWAGNGNGNTVVNYGPFGSDRTFYCLQQILQV